MTTDQIRISKVETLTEIPELASRKSGPRSSKYDETLKQANGLPPKGTPGAVRVVLEAGEKAERALANIRTVIKRKGLVEEFAAGVSKDGDSILIFRR